MILYIITNERTGKRYVGMTTMSLSERWANHLQRCDTGTKTALYSAIRKYGKHCFCIAPVLSLMPGLSVDDLFDLEQEMIAQEETICPRGYNMTAGGEGTIGYSDTPSRRLSRLGRSCSAETRRKMSLARIGRKRPIETVAKMVATRKARGSYPKSQPKLKGRRFSDERKAKMRAAWTPERRAQQAARMIQNIWSNRRMGP